MKNVEIGDTIFIYVGAPIQAVLFKCRVVAVNKPFLQLTTVSLLSAEKDTNIMENIWSFS